MIELRSDTFTKPSAAMREAMAAAEVGDDVWGEDPTVIALQERVAELLAKEAALFVPSGTMANQIAILTHTRPGDLVFVGEGSHCTTYEAGAAAALGGVQTLDLGEGGLFTAAQVEAAIPPENPHYPQASLVWMENTHNRGGGKIFPRSDVAEICRVARARGLATHVDGARLLHAAVATGASPAELAAEVDSTSICLSKGLGAPVGSVLAGSASFIARAVRYRKMLGGGMRQVGILAAAGIYALDHHVDRLADDHKNAKRFAEGITALNGIALLGEVETNIVIFDLTEEVIPAADVFVARCAAAGLALAPFGPRRVRAVTHLDVTTDQCRQAVAVIAEVVAEFRDEGR